MKNSQIVIVSLTPACRQAGTTTIWRMPWFVPRQARDDMAHHDMLP